jgi:hypothetical protein
VGAPAHRDKVVGPILSGRALPIPVQVHEPSRATAIRPITAVMKAVA